MRLPDAVDPDGEVVITPTARNHYASQGLEPAGQAGYDVWVRYPASRELLFVGFIHPHQLQDTIDSYRAQGTTVWAPIGRS